MEFRIIDIKELKEILLNKEVDFKEYHQLPSFIEDSFFLIAAFDTDFLGAIGIDKNIIQYLVVRADYDISDILIEKAKMFIIDDLIYNDQVIYKQHNHYHFTSYDDVHNFILSLKQRVYALDHFKRFMNDFCNVQNQLKVIHIGGTNGKGSTTNYIREVLQRQGYKVASFTSPALLTRLDIIRINNISIPEKTFVSYANRYMDICLKYDLSMFEIEMFIAVMYFFNNRVDYAVIEVGLGGELDATNIVYPLVSVNTNIGLDHTEYLGHTYQEIARTKGGIIKDHVDYITGEKKQECLDVFNELCHQHHSHLIMTKEISNINKDQDIVSFQYDGQTYRLLTGAIYQCYNAALAIEVLNYIKQYKSVYFTEENLRQGLFNAKWQGRFEIIRKQPLIIIDGAHNKEGMKQFCDSAKNYPDIKIIFSALRDKDTHSMISQLLEITDDITICEFEHYRAQKADLLAEDFPVKVMPDWKKAIDDSLDYQGTLFITGSLYFISQVRVYLLNKLYH